MNKRKSLERERKTSFVAWILYGLAFLTLTVLFYNDSFRKFVETTPNGPLLYLISILLLSVGVVFEFQVWKRVKIKIKRLDVAETVVRDQ